MGRTRSGSNASSSSARSLSSVHSSRTSRSAYSSSSVSVGSSTLGFGGLSFRGGSSDAEYAIPTSSPEDLSRGFESLLSDLQGASANPRGARMAACCAALVETAKERRSVATRNSNDNDEDPSPNEMFVAAVSALISLQESFESRLKSLDDGAAESIASDLENAALPLLEILRRVLPYAAHHSNNRGALLSHQFGTLSRMLRAFVALGYALPGEDGGPTRGRKGHSRRGAGGNALLRRILGVTTTLLLVVPPESGVSEKEMSRLIHGVIVPMLHDVRPKVRKAAWGCGVEISAVSSSGDAANVGNEGIVEKVQMQRKVVADFMWKYCRTVMTNYEPGSKETSKLIHVLRFLTAALPFADDERIRVRFGEGCLKLMGCGFEGGRESTELVRETLLTLLSCLETTERESEEDDSGMTAASASASTTREMPKFAARSLAFLLQHRPNSSTCRDLDVNLTYGRCLLACVQRMLEKTNCETDSGNVAASILLAIKLVPNVLASMLHLCENSGDGKIPERGIGNIDNIAEACGSEFNHFISQTIPILIHCLDEEPNSRLHQVAMEILPRCIPVLEEAMQIKYRDAWGSILSGGYATFLSALSSFLLGRKEASASGDRNSHSASSSSLEDQLHLWIKTMVSSLLLLHNDVEKDSAATTAVEYAASTIIRGMGVELFLSVVDFVVADVDDEGGKKKKHSAMAGGGMRDDRAWLLPLMKHSASATLSSPDAITAKTHLAFFQGCVLKIARRCDAASADERRTDAEASIQKARVTELWSLFPHFCARPMDMKENFGATSKTVLRALGDHERYPKLIPIICGGLKILSIGIRERSASKSSPDALEDYEVLSNISTKILPSLFKLVETLNAKSLSTKKSAESTEGGMEIDPPSKEVHSKTQPNMQLGEAVTEAIGQLAQICPRAFLQNLFKKVVQRLLVATMEVSENPHDKDTANSTAVRMCSLLGLGQALVASGSLDDSSLSLLYRAVHPLVRADVHVKVQKRAYKVMAEMCERHKEFVTSDERLEEMIGLMVDSIVTCQVSARHMRLKCMTCIVEGFTSCNQTHMAVIPKIMGEVLLCLKDSNAKTRESAYQLLLAMATARDDMADYFRIVLAALGAQTTHMRSAAVMALSRLIYEYTQEDFAVQSLLPSLMQTVAFLFDDSSREVTKSVIGFIRVSIAAMSPEQLEPLLPDIVGGIMKYGKGRDRFRAKIKIILKKLVRLYGYDKIASLVPEKDSRLITHMRKLSERTARRKAAGVQDGNSSAHNDFDDMMESDEDDSDDGRTLMTRVTGFTKMAKTSGKTTKRLAMDGSVKNKNIVSGARSAMASNRMNPRSGPHIKMELEGEILDMLDASKMARSVRFSDVHKNNRDLSDDEDDIDDMQIDNQGMIVISDDLPNLGASKNDPEHYASDDEENLQLKVGGKRKFESVKGDANGKRQKAKRDSISTLGDAYKSKKAGGDVKKKGQKYEPYAYVPLNAKNYTKKNRGKVVSKMSTVVRSNSKRKKR